MLKNFIITILISIILGGVIAVGVALACARWATVEPDQLPRKVAFAGRPIDGISASGIGVERWQLEAGVFSVAGSLTYTTPEQLPEWIDVPAPEDVRYIRKFEAVGSGWPWICLRTHSMFDVSSFNVLEKEWVDGSEIGMGSIFMPFSTRVIPHGPYWPGLIRNWIVWSLPWLVLWFGWVGTRQIIRKGRGKCRSCGYDLRGIESDKCPECGRAILSRPS